MAKVLAIVCLISVSQAASLPSLQADEDVYKASRTQRRESKARILKAIQKKVTLKFKDVALHNVLKQISRLGNIPIIIDERELNDNGILPTVAVSIEVADESIDRLLTQLLTKAELAWHVDGDAVIVTSYEGNERQFIESFKVGKLLKHAKKSLKNQPQRALIGGGTSASQHNQQGQGKQPGKGFFRLPPVKPQPTSPPMINRQFGSSNGLGPQPMGGMPKITPQDLVMDLIMAHTTGPWQETEGSGGAMRVVGDVLMVTQSFQVLREVGHMIELLNKAIQRNDPPQMFYVREPSYPLNKEIQILSRMQQRLDWSFKDENLSSVLAKFSVLIGAPVKPDEVGLADSAISLEDQVSFQARQVSIETALKRVLASIGAAYLIDGNHVVVTSEGCEALSTVIHQTTDLNALGITNEEIREVLFDVSGGPWYEIEGTGGESFGQLDGILVVSQTKEQLREVADTLAELRRAKPQKEDVSRELVVRSYRLDNLPMNPEQTKNANNNAVAEASMAILSLVEPESWAGEQAGSIHTVGRLLVVKQTVAVHQKIEQFIADHFKLGGSTK